MPQPLQRFQGLLDRMVPQESYGGLLSPADQRAAAQQYRATLASGLLSAAGPQRMPVSLGQALGAAIPQAMQVRDQRAEVGIRNEQLRRQIDNESRRNAAQAKFSGLLRTAGGPDGELLGLLSEIDPQLAVATMTSGGTEAQDPNDLRMMDGLNIPRTEEGFAKFKALQGDPTMKPLLDAVALQMQSLQLANMKRDQEIEAQEARETRLTRENSIKHGIEQTIKIADLTKKLEGTALAAGLPASEWRRSGIGALAAVGGALGLDVEEMNNDLAQFDQFKKNLNDQLITLMSAGSLGQGTDSKLAQYRASLASPDVQPAAVMAIQANVAQTFMDQADVLGIELDDRDAIEASIKEMRNYVPPGTETVIDAPAAASAVGRAVVRVADIGRMGLEELQQLDPASLTKELRDAAADRWDELNAD